MSSDWLPSRDTLLQTFAVNFSSKVTASAMIYGLASGDATALATLVTTYNSTLAAATNPPGRTQTTCAAKKVAKAQLVANITTPTTKPPSPTLSPPGSNKPPPPSPLRRNGP